MRSLVGYTGFVGSNLMESGSFDFAYNSVNIAEAFGTRPDILYFSGLRAEKYLANTDPGADFELVKQAMKNIESIAPKSVILISTIDVYGHPAGADEETVIETGALHPYGLNRLRLEDFIRERYPDHLILRLPALFGKHIKKNFIYDMLNFLPSALSEEKLQSLDMDLLKDFYMPQNNGFYKLREIDEGERIALKRYFKSAGFSALNFTDSRAQFQFFALSKLYELIEVARGLGIRLLNAATQPCKAKELYRYVYGGSFANELDAPYPEYDMRTVYANALGGANGYLLDKESVMAEIKAFMAGAADIRNT